MGITVAQDRGGPRSPIQETLSNRTRRRSITNRHSQGGSYNPKNRKMPSDKNPHQNTLQ